MISTNFVLKIPKKYNQYDKVPAGGGGALVATWSITYQIMTENITFFIFMQ